MAFDIRQLESGKSTRSSVHRARAPWRKFGGHTFVNGEVEFRFLSRIHLFSVERIHLTLVDPSAFVGSKLACLLSFPLRDIKGNYLRECFHCKGCVSSARPHTHAEILRGFACLTWDWWMKKEWGAGCRHLAVDDGPRCQRKRKTKKITTRNDGIGAKADDVVNTSCGSTSLHWTVHLGLLLYNTTRGISTSAHLVESGFIHCTRAGKTLQRLLRGRRECWHEHAESLHVLKSGL